MNVHTKLLAPPCILLCLSLWLLPGPTLFAQDQPDSLPQLRYHLTARPFQPLDIRPDEYLDVLEDLCRYLAGLQDKRGAIVDPYLHREHQYSTPYFAYAIGVLLEADRASELRSSGEQAMEHATRCLAGGWREIPDRHGEFFVAPLAESLELYRPHVAGAVWQIWRERLQTPLNQVLENQHGRTNNWRTYAMKGEWLRQRAGLVSRDEAITFLEDAWLRRTQRQRIATDKWNLYQDWSSDPQSHAVEAVGRGNLLALATAGYDGPHHAEIARLASRGSEASLLWQGPDGQCPPNGRTDNHVFNDLLYQLAFEVMAQRAFSGGDIAQAGQFRRAALLSFRSIARWRRTEGEPRGSFFVTKNQFDPAERVGYQPASQYANYNGTLAFHLAEAHRARASDISERPAPTEIGGYVVASDARFASAVANAGGMQVFANLRGDTVPKYDFYWTPLGVVRFGRVGWDGRLGPSDGAHDAISGRAVTFAPTWLEGNRWVRLAERAEHYRGTLTTEFVHPLLVRFQILYHSVTGLGGPSFRHEFVVTPDGVLTVLHCSEQRPFGLTLPVLVDDGRPLRVERTENTVSVSYPLENETSGDQQNFLVLNAEPRLESGEAIRSAVGWLEPVRVTSSDSALQLFVYPRAAGDPPAEEVRASFRLREDGFDSCLGTVIGDLYQGRTSAGGRGDRLDLDGDGQPELTFEQTCGFVLQLADGTPIALEVDHAGTAHYDGGELKLKAFEPLKLRPRPGQP